MSSHPSIQSTGWANAARWPPPRRRISSIVILENVWDLLVNRVVPGTFFTLLLTAKATTLAQFFRLAPLRRPAMGDLAFFSTAVYQILLVAFFGLVVILFILRSSAIRKADGIWPRISGLAGAFILTVVAAMPHRAISWQVDAIASLLLASGMCITVVALVHLGRCFSIMPEVRGVVMTGPYRYVRHPMYLGEFLSGLGMVLGSLSWVSAGVFVLFIWLQVKRMQYEERGLREIFPSYDGYLWTTCRLIPWLY